MYFLNLLFDDSSKYDKIFLKFTLLYFFLLLEIRV